MKFRFLGDGDCPEWLLAEIYNFSHETAITIRIIANCITDYFDLEKSKLNGEPVYKGFLEQGDPENKTFLEQVNPIIEKKIANVTKLLNNYIQLHNTTVAALAFILLSAARNEVSDLNLYEELLQLGLPQDHSKAICQIYKLNIQTLNVLLCSQTLRISQLKSAEVISSESKSPVAKISLKMKTLNNDEENTIINIIKDDIPILLEELKKARSIMESFKE